MLYLALEMSSAGPLYRPAVGHKFKFKPKLGDLTYDTIIPPQREKKQPLIQIQLAALQW